MNNDFPLVSIICGYYNRENVVEESVRSLINQTYPYLEIVIFDDCSTDGTYNKLKEIAAEDSRIKLIKHNKNKGFVRGLIDSIEHSRGTYIAIHGSGDISYSERIAKQVHILKSRAEIGVVGCYVENVKVVSNIENVNVIRKDLNGSATEFLLKENPFTHGEVMYRRDLYEKAGGYREQFTFTQDFDLWCRLSFYCDFFIVKEILYRRFLLPDGASVKLEKKLLQQMLREFGIQNHELRLDGEQDLVDRYGYQSLFYFQFSKRFLRKIFPIATRAFKFYGTSNIEMNRIVKVFAERYGNNVGVYILNLVYFRFPLKVSLYLLNKKPFHWFIGLFI